MTNTPKEYWRSLDDLADTPEFRAMVEREFPTLVDELTGPRSRRSLLRMMGASLALAGMVGCRWPKQEIVPHGHRNTQRTPGVPVSYATAMELGGVASGLLVTSFDGRPIKVEGNPQHPINRGASDSISQAAVLSLYDPDRSRTVIQRTGGQVVRTDWAGFAEWTGETFRQLRANGGKGLAILSGASSSETLADMKRRLFEACPQAKWYEYEPISRDNEREGAKLAFGKPVRTHLHLDKADVIVCLDADILMTHPAALKHARDFAAGRTAENGKMNRLYVAESNYTVTGSVADHRLPTASTWIGRILRALKHGTGKMGSEERASLEQLASDLKAHQGRCVIVAGPNQPPRVHATAHTFNAELGNVGHTITYTPEPDPDRPTHVDAIKSLASDIQAGNVETLVILGGNPAYNAPADLDVAALLEKVPTRIHLSEYDDETSQRCTWHLPAANFLESWGDARAYDGTLCAIQPLIAPLYDGKTSIELLAMMLDDELKNSYDMVRRTMKKRLPGRDFEASWNRWLHDGVLADSAWLEETPQIRNDIPEPDWDSGEARPGISGRLEAVFAQDLSVYDGRFANNGWLQELPDPVTKITWDNAALIAPKTAEGRGIKTGDILEITIGGRKTEVVAYVLPGHAPDSITLPLGYGRRAAGQVGTGTGFDTYQLRSTVTMQEPVAVQATRVAGKTYDLACTQDHHVMDTVGMEAVAGRVPVLIREASLEEYKHHPDFAEHMVHHPPLESLWTEHEYEGHRWAMSIDLTKCIGCNACVTACQAENNIPVVGKEQVANGREMHWIRVDRYFKGDVEDPKVSHQPVTCHHCENAPCEQVCPVAATVHSSEGLNDMVYNRCIGTRYCSNNCPYKVRRFNYFNYQEHLKEPQNEVLKLAFNPEVTVRSRGVMEKCTFCVQRIQNVKIAAKNEGRPIRDGEVTPACAQACATQAIVFGDLNDPNSRVSGQHAHPRSYAMLAELNVKPRTKYLARLRNPAGEEGTEHAPDHGGDHEDSGHS